MAAKRKQKRTKTPDKMGPSQWRLQHGDFTPPIREADPETGRPVQHRRAVDTLGMMLANGTITQEMHDAGSTFRALFYVAALDGVTRSALVRQPGGSTDMLSERSLDARRRVPRRRTPGIPPSDTMAGISLAARGLIRRWTVLAYGFRAAPRMPITITTAMSLTRRISSCAS